MAPRLIGVGIKPDGSKKPFVVSEKTTKAGLEGIIKKFDSITAVVRWPHNVWVTVAAPSGGPHRDLTGRPPPNLDSVEEISERWERSVLTPTAPTIKDRDGMVRFTSESHRDVALLGLIESGRCRLGIVDDISVDLCIHGVRQCVIREPDSVRSMLEGLRKELPDS